jgi:hypothetical protein
MAIAHAILDRFSSNRVKRCVFTRSSLWRFEPTRAGLYRFGSERFFHPGKPELQLTVWFFAVQSGSVAVFFHFDEPDL